MPGDSRFTPEEPAPVYAPPEYMWLEDNDGPDGVQITYPENHASEYFYVCPRCLCAYPQQQVCPYCDRMTEPVRRWARTSSSETADPGVLYGPPEVFDK